jgi:hypothetical protein
VWVIHDIVPLTLQFGEENLGFGLAQFNLKSSVKSSFVF